MLGLSVLPYFITTLNILMFGKEHVVYMTYISVIEFGLIVQNFHKHNLNYQYKSDPNYPEMAGVSPELVKEGGSG